VLSPTTAWVVGQRATSGVGEIKLVTHDGGATWDYLGTTSEDTGLLAVDFVDEQFGWAVGAGGVIIHTDDGGVTWSVQEQLSLYLKPWLVDVHFVDREHGWAVGQASADGDGWILATTTGGE
jgi:photosystem II stability/assembly factor-like uncharacterized protein